jgi:hypothetical protein
MSPWLDNPYFQAAALPFIIALIAAWVLRPAGAPWAGLGFALAYGTAVYFITGFQLLPLTSTRKILLAAAGAVVVGLALESLLHDRRLRLWLPPAAGAAVALWVIWPLLLRSEGAALATLALAAPVYVAWLLAGVDALAARPTRALIALLMLGTGTGVSALLGASALMGQLGGAVAAATGAYVLVFLLRGEFAPGRTLLLPAALLCALAGVAAVVYASLPWYSLAPLTLIPLLARLPLPRAGRPFTAVVLAGVYTLPAALAAIIITWRVAGAPPI